MKLAKFWKRYIVALSVAFALLFCALAVFYAFIDSYEKSQPSYTARKYLEGLTEEDLLLLTEKWIPEILSQYENAETASALQNKILNELHNAPAVAKNNTASTPQSQVYSVLVDNAPLFDLLLIPDKQGAFGMARWRVSEMLANLSEASLRDYELYVPTGAIITINGISVHQEDLAETEIPYSYVTPYEQGMYDWQLYIITDLLVTPEIVCTLNGEECTATTEGDAFWFYYPDTMKKTYTITAPSEAEVYVNGVLLSADMCTKTTPYPYSEMEANVEDMPVAAEFILEGILSAPSVSGTLCGVPLTFTQSEAAFRSEYPSELLYTCTIRTPQGSRVSLYGVSCDPLYVKDEAVFPELSRYITEAPMYSTYFISGLYANPCQSISVEYKGEDLSLSSAYEGRTVICTADFPVLDNVSVDVEERVLSFIKDYINYTGQGFNNTDKNLENILSYTIKNSEIYKQLERSKIGIQFVTPVTSTRYDTLDVTGITRYSDQVCSCSVPFLITQMTYHIPQEYAGVYEITLAKTDDIWMVVDMKIITK